MNEEDFNIVKKEFNSFKQKYVNDIKSSFRESEDCYLIEDYWIDELEKSINKKKNKKNNEDYSKFIPDYITNINKFSTIINYLQNNKKFELVSKKLLESSYDEDDLKSDICSKYYSGKNKLIIELKDKENNNNNSILLIDPLNKDKIQERAFIISPQKGVIDKSFYKFLIEKDNFNKSEEIVNDIVIFPFEKYSKILKLLVNIYLYERSLRNKDLSFLMENKNENYYLINNGWIFKFKKYYDYISFHISKKGENIDYNNLNQTYENIYSTISFLNSNFNNLYEEITNINNIKAAQKSKSNIPYEINTYIINSQMKELIESILDCEKIDLPKNEIIVKNNCIYLINENRVTIGYLNEKLIFIEKYILYYISEEILDSEKNSLFESPIENYINSINNDESYEIERNNEKIGPLTILINKVKEESPRILKKRKDGKNKNKISRSQMNDQQINISQTETEKIKEYIDKIKKYEEEDKKLKEMLSEKNKKEKEFEIKYQELNTNYEKNQKELKKKENELVKEKQLKSDQIKENEKLQKVINKMKKEFDDKLKEKEEILKNYEAKEKEINSENEKNKKNLIEAQKNLEKIHKEKNELIQKNENEYINKINKLEKKIKKLEKKEKKQNDLEKIKNEELIEKNKELEEKIKEKQNIYDKLLIEIEEKREELINGPQPILVGLNNIGATCFMNSTLQCLSQTKALTDFFLNKKNEDKIINNNIAVINKNDLQLSPIYAQLIKKLWDKNGPKSFSPNEFRSIVEKMNPLFKQGQAGDSKDFIIFILEQIHKELKKPNPNKNQNTVQTLNQYDRANALSYFFNDFQDQLSIISDTFFGINETANECINCKNNSNLQGYYNNPICYNYGIFNLLIFPLEEVKNMRNNNIQYYGYNNGYNNFPNNEANRVSLYECFCYNQKVELFTGENRNYCNICKQLYDSNYVSKIYTCPNILILILNRGRNNIYDVKLDFAETIDITQFVLQPDKPRMIYNLYGVITHIGQSGPNAHFIASCKSQINNKWYRFNDAFVTPITDFQKEIHDFSTPYILFYQKS